VGWIDVAKSALAVYLVVSVVYIVFVYRRRVRSRPAGKPARPDSNPYYTHRWVVAPTPLPEWAYADENQADSASEDIPGAPHDTYRGQA